MKPALAALGLVLWLMAAGGAAATTPADFAGLEWHPHPGAQLPLDALFDDAHGDAVTLNRFFTGKPVVLVLEYLRCKTLCGLTLNHVLTSLDKLPIDAGRDYQFVALSLDPRDKPADAAAAKAKYLTVYRHPGADSGLHFVTGVGSSVRRVADIAGFPYRYDPVLDQYIHPAGFLLAMPDGQISRYVLSVAPSPADLQSGLADAAQGRALSPLTRLLLLCHGEDAAIGRFTVPVLAAFTLLNIAGGLTLIAVFVTIRRRRNG